MKIINLLLILATATFLVACGSKNTIKPVTLSEKQTRLFEQSCQMCHADPNNPAPQVGDYTAWQKRLSRGLPALVQRAMQGVNAMPAGGLCTTCTPPDFEAMIIYMATAEPQK